MIARDVALRWIVVIRCRYVLELDGVMILLVPI